MNDALTPLANMGQILFEPPDVAGWDAGQAWFSTGAMLARMNFASTLAAQPEVQPRDGGQAANARAPPDALLSYVLDALVTAPLDRGVDAELVELPAGHRRRGPAATRSCRPRRPASCTSMAGSPEYQFV